MNAQGRARTRVVFIDVLRLLATFQMVQGHSVDAVLADVHRAGSWFDTWTFLRGLTAVTFLTVAGLAFWAVAAGGRGAGRTKSRVRRALGLVALGYALHMPLAVLWGADAVAAWREATMVDVLHCIGVSLLGLEVLSWRAPGPAAGWVALLVGVLLVGAAPFTNAATVGANVASQYLTHEGGSLFPLFPWSGYVWLGFAAGCWALPEGPGTAPMLAARRLAAASALALAGAVALQGWPVAFRQVSPGYALLKLGCVLGLAAVLCAAARSRRRLPVLLELWSGRSLFVYVVHILVLYGAGVGVEARWGGSLGPGPSVAFAAGMIAGCAALTWAWSRFAAGVRGQRKNATSA